VGVIMSGRVVKYSGANVSAGALIMQVILTSHFLLIKAGCIFHGQEAREK